MHDEDTDSESGHESTGEEEEEQAHASTGEEEEEQARGNFEYYPGEKVISNTATQVLTESMKPLEPCLVNSRVTTRAHGHCAVLRADWSLQAMEQGERHVLLPRPRPVVA